MLVYFLKFPNNSDMPCYLSDFESIFLSLVKFVNSDTIFPSEQRETHEEKEMKKERRKKEKKKKGRSIKRVAARALSLPLLFVFSCFLLINTPNHQFIE